MTDLKACDWPAPACQYEDPASYRACGPGGNWVLTNGTRQEQLGCVALAYGLARFVCVYCRVGSLEGTDNRCPSGVLLTAAGNAEACDDPLQVRLGGRWVATGRLYDVITQATAALDSAVLADWLQNLLGDGRLVLVGHQSRSMPAAAGSLLEGRAGAEGLLGRWQRGES